jgi:transcription termination/antitermination protein NusG
VIDESKPADSTAPIADALETVGTLHDLTDEAEVAVFEDAAAQAEEISRSADEAAEEILEDAVDGAETLIAAGRDEEAEETIERGIEDAAIVEVVGEVEAAEVLAEAAIEVAVMEETTDEIGEELLAEAAPLEAAPAEAAPLEAAPVEAAPVEAAPAKPRRKRAVPGSDAAADNDDPFGGPGDWYVVHTYAGYENKVKANLESRIHTMQMEGKIFRVHIPMEDVMEIKSGKKQVVQKKVFPGYLLVKMIYDNDSWYVVRNTPGVTGFVSAGTGSRPTPLSKREVEKILVVKKEEVKPQFRLGFEEQDVVRIISGPFADFNGTISEINVDQSKLKVLVNIFDRETPVELGFDQVSKV